MVQESRRHRRAGRNALRVGNRQGLGRSARPNRWRPVRNRGRGRRNRCSRRQAWCDRWQRRRCSRTKHAGQRCRGWRTVHDTQCRPGPRQRRCGKRPLRQESHGRSGSFRRAGSGLGSRWPRDEGRRGQGRGRCIQRTCPFQNGQHMLQALAGRVADLQSGHGGR